MTAAPLLEIEGLTTEFRNETGWVRAVDGISFRVARGKTTGLVGESGCGKSVTALSILRLIAQPQGRISAGKVRYGDRDLLAISDEEMRALRGDKISMIFQEPMTSLNPVFTAGDQVGESLRIHRGHSRKQALAEAERLFKLVGIPSPAERLSAYPHQLSGGMRQRVMIAMALACGPDLLIADEPTTALDVTIQAQILELLRRLQAELGMSILLITHDLGVVAETCEEVIVMYAGRIVERAPVRSLFATPRHPYTGGLLASVPPLEGARPERLKEIPGMVPALGRWPVGCKFQDRCPRVQPLCREEEPALGPAGAEHQFRCHFPLEVAT
jgi:peptide/nickel transport system ATP-binding protein